MELSKGSGSRFDVSECHPTFNVPIQKISEAMMNFLRVFLLLATLSLMSFITNVHAETAMVNQHLVKLLGKWDSTQGAIIFNANRTCFYKGRKHICAIAEGTIQISKRKNTILLPYHFRSGKLLITDHGSETTYTRVP
jgi:hypothetical protein